MKRDYELTKENVEIYQGIYYFHFKPLVKRGLAIDEIQIELLPIFADFGWSWRQFIDFQSIDLMQRLVFEHSHSLVKLGQSTEPMTSKLEYRQYDPNFGALRLKNNSLSDDPDQIQ